MKSIICLVKKGDRLDSDLREFTKNHLQISNEAAKESLKSDASFANIRDVFNNRADVSDRNIKAIRAIVLRAEKACEESNEALKELKSRTVTLVA